MLPAQVVVMQPGHEYLLEALLQVRPIYSSGKSTPEHAGSTSLPLLQLAPAEAPCLVCADSPAFAPLRFSAEASGAVSYTHLTLPTICSV